jgi:hypothetical protein
MRLALLVTSAVLAIAAPAAAQLNAYYRGVDRMSGTPVPATAQFSVEKGRVVMAMRGSTSWRMVFVERDKVLRLIDDSSKQYFDVVEGGMPGVPDMEKQLAQMPPEQRQMVQQLMKQTLGDAAKVPATEYAWTGDTMTVAGYACTRVEIRKGGVKRAEYWGTASPDFRISEDERKAVAAMHGYLGNSQLVVRGRDVAARAFEWDTSKDGYPLISRCFDGDSMTVDLKIESWDRKPLSNDLFKVPSGYKQPNTKGMGR